MFWIHDIFPGDRCSAGIWMNRKYWGTPSISCGCKAAGFIYDQLKIPRIYTFTPWLTAARLCERIGMRRVSEIPKYNAANHVHIYLGEAL